MKTESASAQFSHIIHTRRTCKYIRTFIEFPQENKIKLYTYKFQDSWQEKIIRAKAIFLNCVGSKNFFVDTKKKKFNSIGKIARIQICTHEMNPLPTSNHLVAPALLDHLILLFCFFFSSMYRNSRYMPPPLSRKSRILRANKWEYTGSPDRCMHGLHMYVSQRQGENKRFLKI